MRELNELVADVLPDVVSLRRDLHAHPEVAFAEHRTADRVAAELQKIKGLSIRRDLAETAVVALLNESKTGPCVALRADMDALPIQEETDLAYASTHPGTMHACCHDGHTSCLVGTARVLAAIADALPGQVKFIFQPAEEDGAGADVLCRAGVLESPRVDAVFALHACPDQQLGRIAVGTGPVHAATNPFEVTVRGRGTHGGYPHQGIDPIVAACAIVTALQTIVSRTADPIDTAVVTVGQIHAGNAINIIPDTCKLAGTIRTFDPGLRSTVVQRVREIADHVAKAHGAAAEVDVIDGYPVAVNDRACADLVARVGREVLGSRNVFTRLRRSMGGEDFAYYAQKVPAAVFRLGIRPPGADEVPNLHSARIDFNDDALPVGITLLSRIAQTFLENAARSDKPGAPPM